MKEEKGKKKTDQQKFKERIVALEEEKSNHFARFNELKAEGNSEIRLLREAVVASLANKSGGQKE